MSTKSLSFFKTSVKVFSLLLLLAVASFSLLAFKANKAYNDLWQQLGISKSNGEENIRESFFSGYFHYYGASKAKNIATGNRAAVARDLMNYAKQQVNSATFKKQYEELRLSAKPEEPTEKIKTKDEIRKEKVAEMEKSIKDAEKTVKEFPSMAKDMQPVVEMLKTTLKDYKDPESKMIEAYYQNEIYDNESRIRSYKERLARWEKEYPADHKQIIRERLQAFISLAKTVDFNAELKTVGNKKKFVNPKYEGKAYDWKQIYRAGREVIEPAVVFAEQWVKELG